MAYAPSFEITETMICATGSVGGTHVYRGNSGAPMSVRGELAGLASWGVGCSDFGYPYVFSNIAVLRSFITAVTGVRIVRFKAVTLKYDSILYCMLLK